MDERRFWRIIEESIHVGNETHTQFVDGEKEMLSSEIISGRRRRPLKRLYVPEESSSNAKLLENHFAKIVS